ncbi:hypothetical protein O1611_g2801 [Lasiodiplodia mahajangana]|uniref:Uncharacterized protein n=1 Tax=Lasiodiplodia mahajangana TaxID=1108764 RepID=A0ACC2JTL1_9PEZI|nr:hypothetical protein O1611_g2801 [Lasiodiplodia mahajangana]
MEPRARAGKHVGKETFNPKEISALLYAYGDVRDPIPETVRVLDEIVTEFLEGVCFEASRHAQVAGRQKLKFDDFEFALRRNPQYLGKVKAMIEKRQTIKEMRKTFNQDDDALMKDMAARDKEAGNTKQDEDELLDLDDDLDLKDLGAETASRGSGAKRRKLGMKNQQPQQYGIWAARLLAHGAEPLREPQSRWIGHRHIGLDWDTQWVSHPGFGIEFRVPPGNLTGMTMDSLAAGQTERPRIYYTRDAQHTLGALASPTSCGDRVDDKQSKMSVDLLDISSLQYTSQSPFSQSEQTSPILGPERRFQPSGASATATTIRLPSSAVSASPGIHGFFASQWQKHRAPILVFCAQFFGALMNLLARLLELSETDAKLHPMQLLFWRMLISLFVCSLYVVRQQIPHGLLGSPKVRWLLVGRGTAGFFGIYGVCSEPGGILVPSVPQGPIHAH